MKKIESQEEIMQEIQCKIDKDIERMKSKSKTGMDKTVEKQIRKELLNSYLFQYNEKNKKKEDYIGKLQKHIEKKIKKQRNFEEKQRKNSEILSKNENEQEYTGEHKNTIQNTLKQDISRQQYYQRNDWKKLSEYKRLQNKEKNNGLCELCNQRQATEVHHLIKFYNQDTEDLRNELLLDEDNLICLCSECHHNIHNNKLDVQKHRIIDEKRDKINRKYINKNELLNLSDLCFLNY